MLEITSCFSDIEAKGSRNFENICYPLHQYEILFEYAQTIMWQENS